MLSFAQPPHRPECAYAIISLDSRTTPVTTPPVGPDEARDQARRDLGYEQSRFSGCRGCATGPLGGVLALVIFALIVHVL